MSRGFEVEPNDLVVPILCYPFPEVREALDAVRLPQSFHMSTLTAPEASDLLLQGGYKFGGDLVLPTDKGRIDFERIHEPVTARITERNEPQLPGLSDFEHQYATFGSSEAIKSLMAGWSRDGKMSELGWIDGEYIGYLGEAGGLNIPLHVVPSLEEAGEPVEGRVWFLSNPSAIDGNWHDDEVLKAFIEAGHDVVLDYAYGGLTTDEHPLDVSAPNIKAVLTSPSKNFGVFYHRYTGVAYTREGVSTLGSTMWFRSVPALMDTLMLYETFEPHELPRKYKDKQLVICKALVELTGISIEPSDNILMAYTNAEAAPHAQGPGKNYRLSNLFARLELLESIS